MDAQNREKKTDAGSGLRPHRFLTFLSAAQEYGIEILKVQEIIPLLPITRVPGSQRFIKGVINLRGKIIPILDVRRRFGMPDLEPTNETCIIVVHVRGTEMGILVDRVSEVVDIPEEEIEPASSFGAAFSTDCIFAIGKSQGKIRILLDLDRMIPGGELSSLEEPTGL
jgi:purine-binding chemotaxis protein CheW